MDILRIIFRVLMNTAKDLPYTWRRMKVVRWRRRRFAAWQIVEEERLDRLRQPWKYRGE